MFALFRARQGAADGRVKLITELIGAIRIVKVTSLNPKLNPNPNSEFIGAILIVKVTSLNSKPNPNPNPNSLTLILP